MWFIDEKLNLCHRINDLYVFCIDHDEVFLKSINEWICLLKNRYWYKEETKFIMTYLKLKRSEHVRNKNNVKKQNSPRHN